VLKSYLIRNAILLNEGHTHHSQKVDILITEGKIVKIGKEIKAEATIIEGAELYVSAGWTDLRCHLTDPGHEQKDTIDTLLDTAAAGGFTRVVTLPDSDPAITDKSRVNYLKNSSVNHLVDLLPAGMLSASSQADNLAELFDMHQAGAVAFTNGDADMSNGLLKKALLYTKPFGARVITHPSDKSLEQGGTVNESENTIHTGLRTSSSLAEYVRVSEQIEIAKYCDAHLHLSALSCKESVDLVKQAKKDGVNITCDVAIANLCFTDKEVLSFDENFKLYPPLRTEQDRKALVKGVIDGTVDAISSNHTPQNIEQKQMEFDYAEYGSLALQQLYAWYAEYLAEDMSAEQFVKAVTQGPDTALGMEHHTLQVGDLANLTVVDKNAEWVLDSTANKSLSKNTHTWNTKLTGKVKAIFHRKKVNLY
jgi:dihydroorotase